MAIKNVLDQFFRITILVNRGYVPKAKIKPETRMKGQVMSTESNPCINMINSLQSLIHFSLRLLIFQIMIIVLLHYLNLSKC